MSRGEPSAGGCSQSFVFHPLVPFIHSFKEAYPDIELELTLNEGFVDLIEKRTDGAIRIGRLTDSTLHARLLGKSLLYVKSP